MEVNTQINVEHIYIKQEVIFFNLPYHSGMQNNFKSQFQETTNVCAVKYESYVQYWQRYILIRALLYSTVAVFCK